MARRTAKKTKGRKAKTARAAKPRKATRKVKRSSPKARVGEARGASKRITELEAENARLREDLEKLRADLSERPARPTGDDEPGERTLPLDF
jgi:hypothetical protein